MNYLAKNDKRYGYADAKTGEISIKRNMPKRQKKAVLKHEKKHLAKGESGDFGGLGIAAMVGGSIISGVLANKAAGKQAAAQREAQRIATDEQRRQYDQTREDTATQRRVGDESLNYLSTALQPGGEFAPRKFEMGDYTADPGYDFRLQSGADARTNILSSGGMKYSGRALKELERYGQDYGSAEYGNVYNRRFGEFQNEEANKQNYLSRQMQLAGYGAQGINTATGAGMNAANKISGAAQNYGNNMANIQGQKYANISNAATSGIQNYLTYNQNQNMMNMFNDRTRGGAGWNPNVPGDAAYPAYRN